MSCAFGAGAECLEAMSIGNSGIFFFICIEALLSLSSRATVSIFPLTKRNPINPIRPSKIGRLWVGKVK